jgi:hypothetical protein
LRGHLDDEQPGSFGRDLEGVLVIVSSVATSSYTAITCLTDLSSRRSLRAARWFQTRHTISWRHPAGEPYNLSVSTVRPEPWRDGWRKGGPIVDNPRHNELSEEFRKLGSNLRMHWRQPGTARTDSAWAGRSRPVCGKPPGPGGPGREAVGRDRRNFGPGQALGDQVKSEGWRPRSKRRAGRPAKLIRTGSARGSGARPIGGRPGHGPQGEPQFGGWWRRPVPRPATPADRSRRSPRCRPSRLASRLIAARCHRHPGFGKTVVVGGEDAGPWVDRKLARHVHPKLAIRSLRGERVVPVRRLDRSAGAPRAVNWPGRWQLRPAPCRGRPVCGNTR